MKFRVSSAAMALLPTLLIVNAVARSPEFAYRGVVVRCMIDVPNDAVPKLQDAVKLTIDLLSSDEFQTRGNLALASPVIRHGHAEKAELRKLAPAQEIERIQTALHYGFSIQARQTRSALTNAWDGYSDAQCGRLIPLNKKKLQDRPAFLWAGTFVHELAHVAGFFHDGQKRVGNECTIPNVIGDIAEWTAWERSRPAADGNDPFVTWERVCSGFASVCTADTHHRCQIGSYGTTSSR